MERVVYKFKFPPFVDDDDNIHIEKPEGMRREPPVPPGYYTEPDNPLVLINEWRPCAHREFRMSQRRCGAPNLHHRCMNMHCPIFTKELRPEDCDFCEFAENDFDNPET